MGRGAFKSKERSGKRWLIGLLILALSVGLMGLVGQAAVSSGWFDGLDALAGEPSPSDATVSFFRMVTEFGTTQGVIICTLLMVLVLLIRRRVAESVILFGSALTATVAQNLLKDWVGRVRPDDVLMTQSGSFPSGQAFISVAVYAMFFYFLARSLRSVKWRVVMGIVAVAVVGLMSYGRLVMNAHYLSDVLFGVLLGLVWLVVGAWVTKSQGKRERGIRFRS